jgi:hypothetical protein
MQKLLNIDLQPNFDLKNMIPTYATNFNGNIGPNLLIFQKKFQIMKYLC